MDISISEHVALKLKEKHNVTENEVSECFLNRNGKFLEDIREEHWTDPPTQWFIAETDAGRRLKIVFVESKREDLIRIKTAYEPNAIEDKIYGKYGQENYQK